MSQGLDIKDITETLARLERRIVERFRDIDLVEVAKSLVKAAESAERRRNAIERRYFGLRLMNMILLLGMAGVGYYVASRVRIDLRGESAASIIQAFDAALSSLVFLGALVLFSLSLENRLRQKRYLGLLHGLRVIAHTIDLHQLAKDPERATRKDADTPSSPKSDLTPFLLGRYLDYASELLSMTAKLAAWYTAKTRDAVVISAADEVEGLCSGLARKIWQKLIILDNQSR